MTRSNVAQRLDLAVRGPPLQETSIWPKEQYRRTRFDTICPSRTMSGEVESSEILFVDFKVVSPGDRTNHPI